MTCYDECVSQFVTCCHQCAGMRLCRHYLQHQSSAWQRRVLQEQRGGGCVPMPGQRRLAISRSRVPNLDGSVPTAAGNLLSIGTPLHRKDPEIVRSQDTNQQKLRWKKFGEKEFGKRKTYPFECPVRVDSTNPVRASQTTTRQPSARASLDASGEKATASI